MTNQNPLQQMLALGQAPWIDNITRDMLQDGTLRRRIGQGIVGLTSNPTIFQKAIAGSKLYDDEVRQLVREDKSVEEVYDALVLDDIREAARTLRSVYDTSNGENGYVSIEVPPNLAHNREKTTEEACRLFFYLRMPNIMIKIPGTEEGIPAFQGAIEEGINVNVTLLFSLENYRAVARAYVAGLKKRADAGQPIDKIASVASFFVSRVDTAVDKRLDAAIAATNDESKKRELEGLKGKAAIANAKIAYEAFQQIFSGPEWERLAGLGAKPQRCLWASTSTKNPAYRDVIYVEELIGSDTVDTMPPATIDAFIDHGVAKRTLDQDVKGAHALLGALERNGISMTEVTDQLQVEGVKSFTDSFEELIDAISKKREEMLAQV
jgi:transaldolase